MNASLQPFTVTALRQDQPPIRIGLLAVTADEATLTAQQLFPHHILGITALLPQWHDDPA